MTRTGEKIFGLVAILVGLVLAVLAGVEAKIPPLVLVLITIGVIAWVVYYFVVFRPSVTGLKGRDRRTGRGTE